MTTVERTFACPPEDVAAVLSDGWLYGLWVVGATRIRAVEEDWPQEGQRLHHSTGPWPFHLDDHTTVLRSELPDRLVLTARGWPWGQARIDIRLEEVDGGTRLVMWEDVITGVMLLVPAPLRALLLAPRQKECLDRLEQLVLGRSGRRPAHEEDDDGDGSAKV
ncbi:SRPBCC domain-containing protein [uncultured Pseudokineococcus sp.]|uniref:SRPBCC family protein n=1 Tax=uncultured Pseudokineococcus sp. TaxID=1642928 RepID=UPI00260C33B4|nr:SRPBCC domain-containing protein [uncultured Pseudokineococcus sp.]